jgi:hypothetical protein
MLCSFVKSEPASFKACTTLVFLSWCFDFSMACARDVRASAEMIRIRQAHLRCEATSRSASRPFLLLMGFWLMALPSRTAAPGRSFPRNFQ